MAWLCIASVCLPAPEQAARAVVPTPPTATTSAAAAPAADCTRGIHQLYLPAVARDSAAQEAEPETPPPSIEVPSSAATPTLVGADVQSFVPLTSTLGFALDCGAFALNPAATELRLNGNTVPLSATTRTQQQISFTPQLVAGANHLVLESRTALGAPLSADVTIWSGGNTLIATVFDSADLRANGVVVTATLAQAPQISAVATTSNGIAIFRNLPDHAIFLRVSDDQGHSAAEVVSGDSQYVTLRLRGAGSNPPSPIDNNDFHQGTDGWDIGSANVRLIPHSEGSPVISDSLRPDLSAVRQQRGQPAVDPLQRSVVRPAAQPSAMSMTDMDLMLTTAEEGAQSISRTLTTSFGTSSVSIRFRFVTSEINGGYFGTVYDDAFKVTLRSRQRGTVVTIQNSMNGLGLSAFDPGGATKWFETLVPVDTTGDVIEVGLTVENVRDGLLNSSLIIDAVAENTGPFVTISTADGNLPAIQGDSASNTAASTLKVVSEGGLDSDTSHYTYQWLKSSGQSAADYQPVSTAKTYAVQSGDVGHRIFVRVSDSHGNHADSNVMTIGPSQRPALPHPNNEEIRVERPVFNVQNVRHDAHVPANADGTYVYEVQVASNQTFTALVLSDTLSFDEKTDNLGISYGQLAQKLAQNTQATPYYWRARAVVAGAPGRWSNHRSFYVSTVWSEDGETWHWPLDAAYNNIRISGTFMEAFHAGTHGGTDIPVAGVPVYAVRGGTLQTIDPGHGWITLKHPVADRQTDYLHMANINPKPYPRGTFLNQGTRIGTASNVATVGAHLHLQYVSRAGTTTTYLNPLAVDWDGWTAPASANPQVSNIYLRSDRFLVNTQQQNLGNDVYIIARTVDPATNTSPPPSGQRLAPYQIDFSINGQAAYNVQFDTFVSGVNPETTYYAYDRQGMRGNFNPPAQPNGATLGASTNWNPYLIYYRWNTAGLPDNAGPQTITVQARDIDGNSGSSEIVIGPDLSASANTVTISQCHPQPQTVQIQLRNSNSTTFEIANDGYTLALNAPAGIAATLNTNITTPIVLNNGQTTTLVLTISSASASGEIHLSARSRIVRNLGDSVRIQVVADPTGC